MKTKPNSASQKPLEIKRGNVSVRIYTSQNRANSVSYLQFTLVYYSGNQRIRRNFSDLEAAKREAELVATKLANGENEVLRLTSQDRAVYIQASEQLKPLNIPLHLAVNEYVHARSRLPHETSLREAIDFFLRRNPASLPQKTVREVVDELVEIKSKAGRSDVHLKDLEHRLGHFADAMQMPIGQVTGTMIEQYLASRDVTNRTKQNHLRLITTLFNFAIKRRYLSKDALDELEAVEWPEQELTEIEIFSPSQLREILDAARPEIVPWLAIAAFAGLRTAELQRLEWSNVNFPERHIEVPAAKSKTASRRLVPIADNLFAWLQPYAQREGRVTGFENMAKQIVWLVEDADRARKANAEKEGADRHEKFKWKRNALRHSFVSYRLACLKDVAEVALEAGNSANMVFRNYRQLVTENEAKRWFAIVPETEENIVALPQAVRAK